VIALLVNPSYATVAERIIRDVQEAARTKGLPMPFRRSMRGVNSPRPAA